MDKLLRLSIKNDISLISIENANNVGIIPPRVGDLNGLGQLTLSNLNLNQLPPNITNLSNSLL